MPLRKNFTLTWDEFDRIIHLAECLHIHSSAFVCLFTLLVLNHLPPHRASTPHMPTPVNTCRLDSSLLTALCAASAPHNMCKMASLSSHLGIWDRCVWRILLLSLRSDCSLWQTLTPNITFLCCCFMRGDLSKLYNPQTGCWQMKTSLRWVLFLIKIGPSMSCRILPLLSAFHHLTLFLRY